MKKLLFVGILLLGSTVWGGDGPKIILSEDDLPNPKITKKGKLVLPHVLGGFGPKADQAVEALKRVAKGAPDTPKRKKTKVVNVCYYQRERTANYQACLETEKILKSEQCSKHVELVDVGRNVPPEKLERTLKSKKLPSGTVVLVQGHISGSGQRDDETFDKYVERLKAGKEIGFAGLSSAGKETSFDAQAVKKAISTALVNPATWVSSCKSGGLCEKDVCLGTSCQALESTTMVRALNWLDPATKKVLELLCNPDQRDVDKDGDVDNEDMEKAFQCDARKYPPSYVVSARDAKYSAEKKKLSEEEGAIYFSHMVFGQMLFYKPSSFTDPLNAARATELQRMYPKKWLSDQGLLTRGGASLDLTKLRSILKAKKNDQGSWVVTLPEPDPDIKTTCYWSGINTRVPEFRYFVLPDPNHED